MSMDKKSIADGAIEATFLLQVGAVTRGQRHFLGPQTTQASHVADIFAAFVQAAKSSLHIAIYDFRLQGEDGTKFVGALNTAASRGVDVRIAYFKAAKQPTPEAFTTLGSDPAVIDDGLAGASFDDGVKVRGVETEPGAVHLATPVVGEPITAPHNLMHSKYIVRDGMTPDAAVLTGSANFTTDAWAVQDNNILVFKECQELSAYYENDFNEMWQSGHISNTGNFDTAAVEVGGVGVTVMFAPGRGRQIGYDVAKQIGTAQHRLLCASMVISSAPIMAALIDRMHQVDEFAGIFDGPEMTMVLREWTKSSGQDRAGRGGRRALASQAKAQQFEALAELMHYKKSLPFKADGLHNFMHNKFVVIDDTVITGSFNFSNNAQNNAENIVIVEDKTLADAYAGYLKKLLAAYPDTGLPAGAPHDPQPTGDDS